MKQKEQGFIVCQPLI